MSHAQAALAPNISSEQIRNFTRLTFNWPEQIRFRVEPLDSGVSLIFSKETDINTGSLRSALGGIVKNISRSSDGTRVTLTFDKPYRVRHFISGNANGIDILGATSKPAPPAPAPETKQPAAIPEPAPKPAPPAQTLNLQQQPLAEEPEPKAIEATPEEAEQVPAQVPAEQLQTEAAPAEATPQEPAQETVAEAVAEEQAPTVLAPPPAPADAIAPLQDNAPEPVITAEPETPEPQTEVIAEKPAQDLAEVKAETEINAEIETDAPTDPAPAEPAAEPEPQPEPQVPSAPPASNPQQSMPLSPVAPEGAVDVPAEKLEPEPAPAAFTQPPSAQQAETDSGDGSFLITTYSLPTGTEIRFPWVQRTAAAAFMREDVLWIVFSNPRQIDIPRFESILPASVTQARQIPLEGYTALRLQTDGTVYPKVTQPKNSAQWIVTLSNYKQMPARPIALERKVEGTRKPHLFVPTLQYADPVTLNDPLIGDEILVVPYFNPGEGVYPARSFPQLDLLSSAQGIAAVKKDDFVTVQQLRSGFRLTARDGLSLSDDLPELALAELESLGQAITWFPYENWRVEQGQFFEVRRELERQLQSAADVRANSLRLKLAQLYLGEGLANETLAWLEIIEQKDPFFFKDRKLAALRGAAYFLKDDYAAAKAAFMDETLSDYDELKLWKAALSVFEEDRPRFDYMDFFQIYISKYPPAMREKLGIIAADNYINRKSFTRALKTLDTLSMTGLQPQAMPYVNFLLGKIAAENGNIKGAQQLWEPLIAEDANRFVRATTEFALTTMLYNQGEIDRAEAIKRLDRLRVVWRGDALELALLNYLGELYADDGKHLEALRVWQDLVQNFPDSQTAIDTARKMAETFNYLYTQGGADEMSPLQALATYYEFRQLTPIGEAGDIMIQALADRLIGVDLLERAAGLLEHQIKYRQEKLARSTLGAKLALVYVLNENPSRALEILQLTGYGDMPDDLALRRKRIAALAMLKNNEPERAITMLENDLSSDADALRLQLYWQMRNWPDAIIAGERLLGARSDVTAALSNEETQQLLQLSIAYMFERNRNQLDYLRQYYEPLLPDGANKDIFMFVTNPGAPLDPQQFDKVASQIARMEDFMSRYRKQVEDGGLDPIVN